MTTNGKTYLSVADTAKLVRKALKAEFPGIKFSVRSDSYAGGASIRCRWTDGPPSEQVKAVVSLYEGASFDGMIDLKSYHDSILVDADGNPQVVHFGADYIFAERDVSTSRTALYRREVERFVGRKVTDTEGLEVHVAHHGDHRGQLIQGAGSYGTDTIGALARQMGLIRPWSGERCPGTPEVLPDVYCTGCGRYERDHRAPHLR